MFHIVFEGMLLRSQIRPVQLAKAARVMYEYLACMNEMRSFATRHRRKSWAPRPCVAGFLQLRRYRASDRTSSDRHVQPDTSGWVPVFT